MKKLHPLTEKIILADCVPNGVRTDYLDREVRKYLEEKANSWSTNYHKELAKHLDLTKKPFWCNHIYYGLEDSCWFRAEKFRNIQLTHEWICCPICGAKRPD